MIEYIKGDIVSTGKDHIVLESSGMGYFILMPSSSIGCFSDSLELPFENVTVYTHLRLSEDAVTLYGFHSEFDREIFRLLISVNKVGPKAAISVMSALGSTELVKAIMDNNYVLISKAPGIGAKTAQKIILELRDKIQEYALLLDEGSLPSENTEDDRSKEEVEDTIEALVSLGYSQGEAKKAVQKVLADKTFKGQLLTAVLQNL